jgi:hypothetical protein
MKYKFLIGLLSLTVTLAASVSHGAWDVTFDNTSLLPNRAGQELTLRVTGGGPVTGFLLRAQLGDGMGPQIEPKFQSIDFGGGIWSGLDTNRSGGPISGFEQYAQCSIVLEHSGDQVSANGVVAKLIIDTTGVFSGTYSLALRDTDIGADSAFIGPNLEEIGISVANNSISIVPEPSTFAMIACAGLGLLGYRFRRSRG